MPTSEFYQTVYKKIDDIESEMKSSGAWSNKALDPVLLEDMGPFGNNTMPFENWLQFVFIPAVKDIIKNNDEFPETSQVGNYAVYAFDAQPAYQNLTYLLGEFDDLFVH